MGRKGVKRKKLSREEQLAQFYAEQRAEREREEEKQKTIGLECPVCSQRIKGPPSALNHHINVCLDSTSHVISSSSSSSSSAPAIRHNRPASPDPELGIKEEDDSPPMQQNRTNAGVRRTRRLDGAITATSAPADEALEQQSPKESKAVKGQKRKKQGGGGGGMQSDGGDSSDGISRSGSFHELHLSTGSAGKSAGGDADTGNGKKKVHVRVKVPKQKQTVEQKRKAIAQAKSRGLTLIRRKQERAHGTDAPSGPETADEMDYWEQAKETGCSICMDKIKRAVMLPCRHVFCRVCIGRWLDRHNSCPMCRRQLWLEDHLHHDGLGDHHNFHQHYLPAPGLLGLVDQWVGCDGDGDGWAGWTGCNYFACIVICCLIQQVLCMLIVYFVSIGGF